MRDAYLYGTVLEIGLAVVVVAQIQLFREHHVEQCPYSKFFLTPYRAAGYLKIFKLIAGDRGAQAAQLVFVLGDFPDAYLRSVF